MKRIGWISPLFLLCVIAWLWYRSIASADTMRAGIQQALPPGSSRTDVEAYIRSHGMNRDIVLFDYPAGDLRQGTQIYLVTRPAYSSRDIFIMFRFDRKGDQGKLITCDIADTPIYMLPPP